MAREAEAAAAAVAMLREVLAAARLMRVVWTALSERRRQAADGEVM